MRIIGGFLKRKKIFQPSDKLTRPLRDMVKESIFNLIQHSNNFKIKMNESYVLDLFSGSGSFGLECISRGSKMVTFIENHNNALDVLKKNIVKLGIQKKSIIINQNCFDYFIQKNKKFDKFNLIFIDPPYKENNIEIILKSIKENKIMIDGGIIIIHRHKKDKNNIRNFLNVIDERSYGISKIFIGN